MMRSNGGTFLFVLSQKDTWPDFLDCFGGIVDDRGREMG